MESLMKLYVADDGCFGNAFGTSAMCPQSAPNGDADR
jgi:hypothetical protein